MNKKIALIFLLILLLSGCSQAKGGEPYPVKTDAPAAVTGEQPYPYPYPLPTKYIEPTPRSYPEPQGGEAAVQEFTIPAPTADKGVVTGRLFDNNTGEPLAFQTVYLAKRIMLTPGPGYTYGITEKASPHTITLPDGRFAMGEVKPDTYILMIYTPHKTTVVMQPNTDMEMDVVVEAGGVLDLGDIKALSPLE
ncbi:MAG: carboxypeptidase-like regulatory domain-containing protein [Chloroflexi bacterium]|nr:carboxypeptidase-like regulatory domain-containing protein [Chloroflexota bacterium]